MTYQEALDWLYSTQLFGIKLGLDSPRRLLREYLAYPPFRTKVVHVAGTNGKGSTCAFIDSLARAAGMRTGLFTSPHLVRYGERVRVSGAEIPEDEIARHLTALRRLVADWEPHPTFFELTLALGLKHFAERNCELIVLETGMGGRLDATSAVPADVAVLTPISLDHQQWLGTTLAEIAAEKAAIIRTGKPAFSAPQEPAARAVIEQAANEQRAPLEFIEEPLLGYSLGLVGAHQYFNAALAVQAAHTVGVPLSYETVKAGLATTLWPGRFETVSDPPVPDCPTLTLDIAHNPGAAVTLAETWRGEFGTTKARLIFGAVESKDVGGIFEALLPIADDILLVPVNSTRARDPQDLFACLPADHPPARVLASVPEALAMPSPHPVLVTGSAFLVGEAKAWLDAVPHRAGAQ